MKRGRESEREADRTEGGFALPFALPHPLPLFAVPFALPHPLPLLALPFALPHSLPLFDVTRMWPPAERPAYIQNRPPPIPE